MKTYKLFDKKQILASYIETLVFNGYDITGYLGKPLSHWNYDSILENGIEIKLQQEMELNDYEVEFYHFGKSDVVVEKVENTDYKEIEPFTSSKKQANDDGCGGGGCFCCGQEMSTDQSKRLMVHMNTNGYVMNTMDEENLPEDRESQGCFPIGSSCAKKMKGFVFKPTEDGKSYEMN